MSNYLKYKIYKKLIQEGYIKTNFISKQSIFDDLNKDIKTSPIINFKQNLSIVSFKLLNLICIFKLSFKKLSSIHYWIPNQNSKNYIDLRSEYFLGNKNLYSQINLVRTNSFISSIYLLFTLPNIIFLNGFNDINFFKDVHKNKDLRQRCLFYENSEKKLRENLKNFFLNQNIKKLITIDDYRIIQNFLSISKELKIKTIAYQHGRFNKFQLGLKGLCFDKYYLWSFFFKKKLINLNKGYKKKLLIVKNFRFKKSQTKKNSKNILYICEQHVPIKKMINDINILIKNFQNNEICIRLREKQLYPEKFLSFLYLKKIRISKENVLFNAIYKNNIKYLIAYSSTALLEASMYNVFPLMPVNNNFYSKEYIKDKLVFKINKLNYFDSIKKKEFPQKNNNNLRKIRKKLWS